MREIIESKESLLIMGHKISDIDSFGAAIGIHKAEVLLHNYPHKSDLPPASGLYFLFPAFEALFRPEDKSLPYIPDFLSAKFLNCQIYCLY